MVTPALRREVPCRVVDRVRVCAVSISVVAIVGFVSVHASPRVAKMFGESKASIAKQILRKYAHEAYPQWAASHPGRVCPARLDELNGHMNNKDVIDPWGHEYRMFCGRHGGIVVQSIGEDHRAGTSDDLWSNP